LIADGRDLFTGGNLRTYGVPVYTGNAVVGTIRIGLRDGNWGFEGLNIAPNTIDTKIIALRERFKKEKSIRVVKVVSRELGIYIAVVKGDVIHYITPAVEWAANIMSIERSDDGDFPLIEYGQFKARLSARAKSMLESTGGELQ
jgi:hypothetical protein